MKLAIKDPTLRNSSAYSSVATTRASIAPKSISTWLPSLHCDGDISVAEFVGRF
jgi:hypothetical protein